MGEGLVWRSLSQFAPAEGHPSCASHAAESLYTPSAVCELALPSTHSWGQFSVSRAPGENTWH